jgi:Flp pilus assembly protein TadG
MIRSTADAKISSVHAAQQPKSKNGFGAKLWRACRMDEAGATAVEFAFIMPILLIMFSGIVQFGSVFFIENHMSHVARDATRQIVVGELAQDDVESAVQQSLINWGVNYNVSVVTVDQDVTVAISLPMSDAALMDALGLFQTGTLTAAVTMRQES